MKKFISYLQENNYSEKTICIYKSVLKNYLNLIKNIKTVKNKLGLYKNYNTIILHKTVLLIFYKFNKWKNLYENLKKYKTPKKQMILRDVFTKEYIDSRTKDLSNDQQYFIKFLFETGIRANELNNIISIEENIIRIKGKGNKVRDVYCDKEISKLYRPFSYSTKTLRKWVKKILGQKFTPHSIRRSHVTHAFKIGINPKIIMEQLGHKKIETTFSYLQLNKTSRINEYQQKF